MKKFYDLEAKLCKFYSNSLCHHAVNITVTHSAVKICFVPSLE